MLSVNGVPHRGPGSATSVVREVRTRGCVAPPAVARRRAARTEYVFKVGVQRALLVAPEVGLGDLCVAGRRSYAHLEGA